MTPFSKHEETLIPFLKQYRPLPPTVSQGLEEQIITQIQRESQTTVPRSLHGWWWGIPGAIVAGAVILWGSSRILQPTAQVADNSQEIEAFLLENWSATTGQSNTSAAISATPITSEWMSLAEPHTVFVGARQ